VARRVSRGVKQPLLGAAPLVAAVKSDAAAAQS
jgi:hypothetical protein